MYLLVRHYYKYRFSIQYINNNKKVAEKGFPFVFLTLKLEDIFGLKGKAYNKII